MFVHVPAYPSRRRRSRALAAFVVLIAMASLLGPARGTAHAQSPINGRSYALYVGTGVALASATSAGPLVLGDTGYLQPGGTPIVLQWVNYDASPYLTADTLRVTASDDGDCHGSSSIHAVNVRALIGDPAEISLSSLDGDEEDDCCVTQNYPDAYDIQGLTIGGTPITVTGALNQTVILPGIGRVVLNEVIVRSPDDCDDDDFDVIALHLYLDSGGEVILGDKYSHSDDDCCPVPARQATWGSVKSLYRD